MTTKDLYLISGLGADHRVFDGLDLRGYSAHFLEWIPPIGNESIEAYANRFRRPIKATGIPPVLLGVSFGGMMAVEIAKQIPVEKIILISSAATRHTIPFSFRLMGLLKLNRLLPLRLLKSGNPVSFWSFGVHGESEKKRLTAILKATDDQFLKWALDKIANWKNESVPVPVVTITGTKDRLLPNPNADYKIEGGGHLMIMDRADEINAILRRI